MDFKSAAFRALSTTYIINNEGSKRRDEYKVMMMIEGNGERIKSLRRRREESTEWVT